MTDNAATVPAGQSFALSGVSTRFDPVHMPVRGDLAHVRLAGKVFVPHYAVPMPHRATQATPVFAQSAQHADPVGALVANGVFDVLDMAGDWAWGVIAGEPGDGLEFGPVGYVPLALLKPCA
ncbi:MAG: hypothetical protein CL820_08050 [Croceicoccus sp.]|nr:hypothetical protein [Croceicoccus sp.]MAL25828.1 hypothetical protein [Croceicoccus sp.]